MAEGDATVSNHFKEQLLSGALNLANGQDTIKVILLTTGHSISADGNRGYADVSTNEISGSGYTAGGATLANQAVAQDDTNDRASFDGDNITWSSLAANTIICALMYDDTVTTPVADPVMIEWEIATNSNGGDYTLQFHADGILLLS